MAERSQTGTIEDAVKNPRLQALVRYWHSKRDGRSIPSRQRIDPIEIPRILPIVLMADVTTTGARMRLLGTDTTATYGQETRGKWVHEFKFGNLRRCGWKHSHRSPGQASLPALMADTAAVPNTML